MEFDPVGSAEFIPDMIKNDTIMEVLDIDQLSECLKHITLNYEDSLYVIEKVHSTFNISDRFKAIRHINTYFGEGNEFDSKKFIEFLMTLGSCLHFDIFDQIVSIIESSFCQNTSNIRISQVTQTDEQSSVSQMENYSANKNIEALKRIHNFDGMYKLFRKIAIENDKEAMDYGIKENICYVTDIKSGRNVLTKASAEKDHVLLKHLIESNIDVNTKDNVGNTALIVASERGFDDIVKLLVTAPGIDVNAQNKWNNTALILAAYNGHLDVVKVLLTVPGIDIRINCNNNNTVLYIASRKYPEIAKILRSHGVKV